MVIRNNISLTKPYQKFLFCTKISINKHQLIPWSTYQSDTSIIYMLVVFYAYFRFGWDSNKIQRGFVPGFVNYKKVCTRFAAASDKVYQLIAHGRRFSQGIPASSTTKTARHDIAEILLKVALNIINQIKSNSNILANFSTIPV